MEDRVEGFAYPDGAALNRFVSAPVAQPLVQCLKVNLVGVEIAVGPDSELMRFLSRSRCQLA